MDIVPLWKRCRALALGLRVNILLVLSNCPGCCVKAVATELSISEDVASKHLQILAGAGWVYKKPAGRYLHYTLGHHNVLLNEVLTYSKEKGIDRCVFMITALTHERRVLIVKALAIEPMELDSLSRKIRIPRMALRRHLDKLERRGFLQIENKLWTVVSSGGELRSKLIDSGLNEVTPAQV